MTNAKLVLYRLRQKNPPQDGVRTCGGLCFLKVSIIR